MAAASLLSRTTGLAQSPSPADPAAPRADETRARTTDAPQRTATRRLGSLEVSALGFGCQNFVPTYNPPPVRQEAIKVIQAAYDRGVTLFDTAEAYGPFTCEEITGEALAPMRDRVSIETKFGWNIDPDTGKRLPGLNSQPAHIKQAVDGMLKRLRTDHIDLLYQHRIDPAVPIEEVAGAVKELIQAGKVRHFGLCEVGEATIRRAHAVQPMTAVQSEYSVWTRDPELEAIPTCEELGIGFVPWAPLGMGYLTGTVTPRMRYQGHDFRATQPRFTVEARRANWAVVELLQRVADRLEATTGQVALAWLLARKPWIVPIPGTTNRNHAEQNMDALQIELTADDMKEIEEGFAKIHVQGARLSEPILAFSDPGAKLGTSSKGGHGLSRLP